MLIRCKLIRPGGTRVTIGKREYHFVGKKEDDPVHVCEVSAREHIAAFLKVPEAYELAGDEEESPKGKSGKGKKAAETEGSEGGDTDGSTDGDQTNESSEAAGEEGSTETVTGDK